ncbi:hypothetical protein Gotur_034434 [Gossypium turneri]
MVWLCFLRLWDMLTRRSLTYLIGLKRELHQSRQFWQKLSGYSPLKEIVATPRRDDISEEKWMGAVGYAPLLVLRQYRSRQFVPATQGLAECAFPYMGDGYKKRVREMVNVWSLTHRMKRLVVGPMITPEYSKWWVKRINDNVPRPSQENSQSIGEHLRVIPSELEIIK